MYDIQKKPFYSNGFFQLQNQEFLINQRKAGKVASEILSNLELLVKNRTTLSLIQLNDFAEDFIIKEGCLPTFKGYNNFPAAVCISVNEQLVHGIPSDYLLQEGDLVTFDLGVTYKDAIVDTAVTCIYGNPKNDLHVKLINSTNEALNKAIKSISIDKKIGVIGNAIYKSATNNGFSVITDYGGHAISKDYNDNPILHAQPFISNKSSVDEGIRIQPGLIIAIEPMLSIGSPKTKILNDKWTIVTDDINAHAEHTVFVHNDHIEILTERN